MTLEYVKEEEEDATTTQGKPGFKILFEFSPNDFFENKILEKTYLYQDEVGYSGDFIYDRAIGTKIQWKEDKDLTKEFEFKKQRNKSAFLSFSFTYLPRFWLLDNTFPFQTPTALVSFVKLVQQIPSSTFSPHRFLQQKKVSRTVNMKKMKW